MHNKLPLWFRQELPDENTLRVGKALSESRVHTVCQEAICPNINRCFKNNQATFMILGDTCTRNCSFCAVAKSENSGLPIDWDEPYRISRVVSELDLKYVVITSVTRDDLTDGGAGVFARTIELIHSINPKIKIEALIPDFKGGILSIKKVLSAGPNVLSHNLETVCRLHRLLKPQADYQVSLNLLKKIKELSRDTITKSSLMLGLGETEAEVIEAMNDIRKGLCDILTLGQYLSPSDKHYPVKEFINPEQFAKLKDIGLDLGFKAVFSGPLVRSSYMAEDIYEESLCMI